MTSTVLIRTEGNARREAISAALRDAGIGVVDVVDYEGPAIAPDAARSLSHALRTPLSAMAGWVHLIETGKLDEAGLKRAATRLRGNIDDQVKTIERYLGTTPNEGRG